MVGATASFAILLVIRRKGDGQQQDRCKYLLETAHIDHHSPTQRGVTVPRERDHETPTLLSVSNEREHSHAGGGGKRTLERCFDCTYLVYQRIIGTNDLYVGHGHDLTVDANKARFAANITPPARFPRESKAYPKQKRENERSLTHNHVISELKTYYYGGP